MCSSAVAIVFIYFFNVQEYAVLSIYYYNFFIQWICLVSLLRLLFYFVGSVYDILFLFIITKSRWLDACGLESSLK